MLILDSQPFFPDSTSLVDVPLQLIDRNKSILWLTMAGLFFSFLFLSIAQIGSNKVVNVFSKLLIKNSSIIKIINEEYSLSNFSSFVLLINFLLTSSILLYLSFIHFNLNPTEIQLLYLPIFPIYFLLWPILTYNVIGFLTNEKNTFIENKKNIIVISQILGICFSFLLLIWAFNIKWSSIFLIIFVGLFLFFWIYKIFRGIIFSFQHNIAWYYIILYFCTLEILPILLLYKVLFD